MVNYIVNIFAGLTAFCYFGVLWSLLVNDRPDMAKYFAVGFGVCFISELAAKHLLL